MKTEEVLVNNRNEFREEYDDDIELSPLSITDYISIIPFALMIIIIFGILYSVYIVFFKSFDLLRQLFKFLTKTWAYKLTFLINRDMTSFVIEITSYFYILAPATKKNSQNMKENVIENDCISINQSVKQDSDTYVHDVELIIKVFFAGLLTVGITVLGSIGFGLTELVITIINSF